MGKTTATLPLTGKYAGGHHERCPACATVYRSKRRTRFRCPSCHRLAYAIATPEGEPGIRRTRDGDDRTYRILPRRRQEGEATPEYGRDVVLFLEEPDAAAPSDAPEPADHPGGPPARSRARANAREDRARAGEPADPPARTGRTIGERLARFWHG